MKTYDLKDSERGWSCFQHEKREWAQTILSVEDTKPARLPIVDVAIKDIGNARQKFKLEVGQVCYS